MMLYYYVMADAGLLSREAESTDTDGISDSLM